MKPPLKAKLSGKFLRMYHKVQGQFYKTVPTDELIENISGQYAGSNYVKHEISDDITLEVSVETSSPISYYPETYRFKFFSSNGRLTSYNGLPPSIVATKNALINWDWFGMNEIARLTTNRWGSQSYPSILHHSPDAETPATFSIRWRNGAKLIKKIGYYTQGKPHSINGPAIYTSEETKLTAQWFIYGKQYSLGEMKKMVKNPYRIGKHDQLMLKLMLAPVN